MRVRLQISLLLAVVSAAAPAAAQSPLTGDKPGYEYRLLATSMTHTMELELNRAAEEGFRFQTAMGGETANGGNEVVVVMARRAGERPRVAYKLLATSKTSTMEKELQAAADQGFEYRAQSVFKTAFTGDEVVCILERDKDAEPRRAQYRLLATTKTSTLEKEMQQAGAAGYAIVGMTVAKTAFGGKELVAIMRRFESAR
jgi:hypothetical protein